MSGSFAPTAYLNTIYPNLEYISPDANDIKNKMYAYFPYYKEFATITKYSNATNNNDGSTIPLFRKFQTNSFGTTNCNIIDYVYNGKINSCTPQMVSNFNDCNSDPNYFGYSIYGNCMNYYWWGQQNILGKVIDSGIFAVDSNINSFINPSSCGSSWANTSCRQNLYAYANRSTVGQKIVFMIR